MEEVVAKKKGALVVAYSAFIVVGLIFAIVGFIVAIDEGALVLVVSAIGLAFVGLGVWQIVVYCKIPNVIIVYRDGMLYFPNGVSCSPLDISHCKITITRNNGIANRWGKLTLTLSDGRVLNYNYVDHIEDVQQRLGEIKSSCYDEMMRRKYEAETAAKIAAATAATAAPVAEPVAPVAEPAAPVTEPAAAEASVAVEAPVAEPVAPAAPEAPAEKTEEGETAAKDEKTDDPFDF